MRGPPHRSGWGGAHHGGGAGGGGLRGAAGDAAVAGEPEGVLTLARAKECPRGATRYIRIRLLDSWEGSPGLPPILRAVVSVRGWTDPAPSHRARHPAGRRGRGRGGDLLV